MTQLCTLRNVTTMSAEPGAENHDLRHAVMNGLRETLFDEARPYDHHHRATEGLDILACFGEIQLKRLYHGLVADHGPLGGTEQTFGQIVGIADGFVGLASAERTSRGYVETGFGWAVAQDEAIPSGSWELLW